MIRFIHASAQALLVVVGGILLAGACARGNGLPGELTDHLAQHGIDVRVVDFDAPLSSRGGVLFCDADPALEARLVEVLELERIEPGGAAFELVCDRVGSLPTQVWGLAGRPAQLELANGAQLEFLYLATDVGGRTCLVAEYAYG